MFNGGYPKTHGGKKTMSFVRNGGGSPREKSPPRDPMPSRQARPFDGRREGSFEDDHPEGVEPVSSAQQTPPEEKGKAP